MKRVLFTLCVLSVFLASHVDVSARGRHGAVNRREGNQMQRIRQGERSGQLTAEESKELREDEREIRKKVREERIENGGHLTAEQRKEVHQDLKEESKKIYELKHNSDTQPAR